MAICFNIQCIYEIIKTTWSIPMVICTIFFFDFMWCKIWGILEDVKDGQFSSFHIDEILLFYPHTHPPLPPSFTLSLK